MRMGPTELTPDGAAAKAEEELGRGTRRVAIVGRPGSGRSLALQRLSERLPPSSSAIRLSLSRADDAALVAIVDLARQVASEDNSLIDLVRNPRERWATKLSETLRVVGQKARTILFEDPLLRSGDGSPSIFTLRTQELTTTVGEIATARIVYAAALTDPISTKIHVRTGSSPDDILADSRWSLATLREAASALLKTRSADLGRYSPLELRLATACVASGTSASEIVARRWAPGELVAGALSTASRLRRVVGCLARCRVPFDMDLASCFLDDDLSVDEARLLREALLIHEPQGFLVHEVVARHARTEGWAAEAPRSIHEKLARWHRERFDRNAQGNDVGTAMRHELEVVHHLTEAGDAAGVLGASVFFSEQYDALGKALSTAKRYDDAVKAYQRALEHDDEDAYAHHYLAYNLDVPGLDPQRVRDEYVRARSLQREHVWYHSRLITFLVTVGRVLDAEDAWAEALAELPSDESASYVHQELHRNVAMLLLHRGELTFAKKVLKAVPPSAREANDWYRPLEERLRFLEEAASDKSIFPPVVRIGERWDGPHLPRNPSDRAKVASWMPGRITRSDDDGIRVRFGRLEFGAERFAYKEFDAATVATLSPHVQHGLSLPEGTFVELLTYKDGSEQLLTWQRQASELSPLSIHPPPDRYIRRAVARS